MELKLTFKAEGLKLLPTGPGGAHGSFQAPFKLRLFLSGAREADVTTLRARGSSQILSGPGVVHRYSQGQGSSMNSILERGKITLTPMRVR